MKNCADQVLPGHFFSESSGYSANWQRTGDQVERGQQALHSIGKTAAVLSVRGMQGRDGHHGRRLQKRGRGSDPEGSLKSVPDMNYCNGMTR